MHNMQQLIEETLKLQKQAYHAGYQAGQQKERKRLSRNEEICPVCGAHKQNYLEAMGRPCHEEHGGK